MRIAILSVGDYRHITLISKYTNYFDEHGVYYDVICTDRHNDSIARSHVYQFPFSETKNSIEKIKEFLRFRRWAIEVIKENTYDFIVVWNENTALLFSDFLLINFKNKYCVNIRDVDFLDQKFLNIIRGRVVRNSRFSTYCSTAPLDFPKGYSYYIMRSMNLKVLKHVNKRVSFRSKSEPIRIGFLGKIRFPEANEEIIRAFGNDARYQIFFIGSGSETLEEFKKNVINLHLIGTYEPEDTAKYLEELDVINSYFGTKVLGYERMSSIRFSYAPYMHIPVIVGANTNMEEEGVRYGFAYGFGRCPVENEADNFFKWYHCQDVDMFIEGCEAYCDDVKNTDEAFYCALRESVKG